MGKNNTQNCFFLTNVELSHDGYVFLSEVITCVLNSILSITATLWNVMIVFVIWKTPFLHSPSNVLICCLACSDFVIGLVAQPSFVAYKVAEIYQSSWSACLGRLIHWIAGFVCAGVSVMTIAAISVDKFLALHLHLRYAQEVTVSRVLKVVFAFWFFCVTAGISLFLANSDRYWTLVPLPVLLTSLTTTFVAYVKVFGILRHHRNRIEAQTRASFHSSPFNMRRYKKSLKTTVYVLMMFLACYAPFLTSMVVRLVVGYNSTVKMAYEWGATVVYLNSTLNPLLYCIRMHEIRLAIYNALRKVWAQYDPMANRVFQISYRNESFES